MEIIKVSPRGYCKGVVRAINIAKECATMYPNQKITVLGMLVHNRYVMEALQQQHIDMIDNKDKTRSELLDGIDEGIVIFTAHGINDEVIAKAQAKGLKCIDASCPDVVATKQIVKKYLENGYDVLYIGKRRHPEAEAICGISNRITLIENESDIPFIQQDKVFVTNQTTMSIFDIEHLFDAIKKMIPNAIISEEICNATRIRQMAVAALQKQDIDVLYVVGDASSNNSNRLAQIAMEHGVRKVYRIDDVQGIKHEQLQDVKKVAVTSGASTPTYLTNQVIAYLENYERQKALPSIDIAAILR